MKKTTGKRSAKEAIPGGALGILVGVGLAWASSRYGIRFPEGSTEILVGALGSLGSVVSSYVLGNRRHDHDLFHQGPGSSDSVEEATR